DGIRDFHVTGVQTCALPIYIGRCIVAVPGGWVPNGWCRDEMARLAPKFDVLFEDFDGIRAAAGTLYLKGEDLLPARTITGLLQEIGRAPCREAVQFSVRAAP